jgi:serine/threonine protein kinase
LELDIFKTHPVWFFSVCMKDLLGLVGRNVSDSIVVEEPVAQGGFGIVYRARHTTLGVPIALKVLYLGKVDNDAVREEALKHFQQEALLVARLTHPATVKPYDAGLVEVDQWGRVPWLALQWLEGKTLSVVMRESNYQPWTAENALTVLRPICEALAEAHEQHIAHRDVAPSNIFLCPEKDHTTVRLIDFGIARVMQHNDIGEVYGDVSASNLIAFARRFPSPEQYAHEVTGPWTDVHALGLLATHLLTGRFPYDMGLNDPDRGVFSSRRPTPGRLGFDVGSWEPVFARALSLRPEDRHHNAREFLSDLLRSQDTTPPIPTVATPASEGEPALKITVARSGEISRYHTPTTSIRVHSVELSGIGVRAPHHIVVGDVSLLLSLQGGQFVIEASAPGRLYGDLRDRNTKGTVYLTLTPSSRVVYYVPPSGAAPSEIHCHVGALEKPATLRLDALHCQWAHPHADQLVVLQIRATTGASEEHVCICASLTNLKK